MRVDIYRCLRDSKKTWSVRSREPPQYGRVVAHTNKAIVTNPDFIVQAGGRQRMIDSGQKNVHAFVRGTRLNRDFEVPLPGVTDEDMIRVRYEKKYPFFTNWDQTHEITSAQLVRLFPSGTCVAIDPTATPIENSTDGTD